MLEVARLKPPAEGSGPISYIQSPAVPLRVTSGTFDLVTCQQSLQFFPDRLAALREMKRALRPGGQIAIAVWTGIEDNEWFTAIQKALLATLGAEAAKVIEAAGFENVRLTREEGTLTFENGIEQALETLIAMPIAPILETLPKAHYETIIDRLRVEAQPLLQGGALIGKMASNIAVASSSL
jgi:SAM-dependent methyltransferase